MIASFWAFDFGGAGFFSNARHVAKDVLYFFSERNMSLFPRLIGFDATAERFGPKQLLSPSSDDTSACCSLRAPLRMTVTALRTMGLFCHKGM
jgi:hypothetical protein